MVTLMPSRRIIRPAAAVVASLVLAGMVGCSDGGAPTGSGSTSDHKPSSAAPTSAAPTAADDTPSEAAPTTSASSTSGTGQQDGKALLTAGALAEGKVPDSTLTSIERERGGWEVQVVTADGTEHQLDLSADGDKVLRGPTEEHDDAGDKAEHQARVADASVDYRAAVKTLLKAVPGGDITELNLDGEGGSTVWEADVLDGSSKKHEVRIDARSGKVLRNAIDD